MGLEKVYDRADRKRLWDVLQMYWCGRVFAGGILIFLWGCECLYAWRVSWVSFGRGVKQECVMSPWPQPASNERQKTRGIPRLTWPGPGPPSHSPTHGGCWGWRKSRRPGPAPSLHLPTPPSPPPSATAHGGDAEHTPSLCADRIGQHHVVF